MADVARKLREGTLSSRNKTLLHVAFDVRIRYACCAYHRERPPDPSNVFVVSCWYIHIFPDDRCSVKSPHITARSSNSHVRVTNTIHAA